MAKKDQAQEEVQVEEAEVAPEVPAEETQEVEEASVEEEPKKGKGKKGDYEAPQTGVSSQGAAVFAPGRHPKHRQVADKLNPPVEE